MVPWPRPRFMRHPRLHGGGEGEGLVAPGGSRLNAEGCCERALLFVLRFGVCWLHGDVAQQDATITKQRNPPCDIRLQQMLRMDQTAK